MHGICILNGTLTLVSGYYETRRVRHVRLVLLGLLDSSCLLNRLIFNQINIIRGIWGIELWLVSVGKFFFFSRENDKFRSNQTKAFYEFQLLKAVVR